MRRVTLPIKFPGSILGVWLIAAVQEIRAKALCDIFLPQAPKKAASVTNTSVEVVHGT